MIKKKRNIFVLAVVLCLGIGITAFAATYTGRLVNNGTQIGSGKLEHNTSTGLGTGTTYSNSSNGRCSVVTLTAYNTSGSIVTSKIGNGSLTAVASISGYKPKKYKSVHTIKRTSDGYPLASTTLYSVK